MNTPEKNKASSDDKRWGDHVPWSLRHSIATAKGDSNKFLELLSTRLGHFFTFNEGTIENMPLFGAKLLSESLGRFGYKAENTLPGQITAFFSPAHAAEHASALTKNDKEVKVVSELESRIMRLSIPGLALITDKMENLQSELRQAKIQETASMPIRYAIHWHTVFQDRMEVLQSLLFLLHKAADNAALESLRRDIRRFAAECRLSLDIAGTPPVVVPLEEPLLQKEVIDKLLPRLEARYPERAKDLTAAYRDLLKGADTNTVFGNAFKTLEELAREVSSFPKLELSDRAALEKYFPNLHGTIRETIIKLAAHRGDEGAHGRKGPDEYEIRYLLFCICNMALVLMEYKEHCG